MQIDMIRGDRRGKDDSDFRDALPLNMEVILKPMLDSNSYMQQTYGLNQVNDAGTAGNCRGSVYNRRFNQHFFVIGSSLCRIKDGDVEILGRVTGSEQVSMPYSFNTQAVIAGGNYYLYDDDLGFRQVVDAELGTPVDCVWISGFYVFTDGENIYHTDISDESEISPFNFGTSEYSPDKTLAVKKTDDNKLMVLDRQTISYFVADGTTDFGFTYLQSNTLRVGLVATHAVVELNERHYMIGSRSNEALSVWSVALGQETKVSTREIDKTLAKYSEADLQDVRLEGRQVEGQYTLIMHLPNETLAMNIGLPIPLAWYRLGSGRADNFQAINGVYNGKEWVYGNKNNSTLAALDTEKCLQYGERAQWEIFTPLIKAPTNIINIIEIDIIAGVDDDDTVFMSISRDGLVYDQERRMSYGDFGNYSKRLIIRAMGYVRNWVSFRLRGYTASKMSFCRMEIN